MQRATPSKPRSTRPSASHEREQMFFFIRLELYHKPPDSGERQYRSTTLKWRFDRWWSHVQGDLNAARIPLQASLDEAQRIADLAPAPSDAPASGNPLSSKLGTYKTVEARSWPWLSGDSP